MRVKNKATGEVVGMHYGPAMEAVAAGTHEVVHEESAGVAPGTDAELKQHAAAGAPDALAGGADTPEQPLPEDVDEDDEPADDESAEVDGEGDAEPLVEDGLDAMTKEQLLAEAQRRGRADIKPTMRKDEIIAALRAGA